MDCPSKMKISHKRRLAFGLHWFAGFCARRTVPNQTWNRARCQVRMARLNTITGPVCVSEQRFEVSVLLCACSEPPASESRCGSVLVFASSSPGCFCGVAPIPISGSPSSIMTKPCRQCSSAPSVKWVGPSFWRNKCETCNSSGPAHHRRNALNPAQTGKVRRPFLSQG